MREKRGVVMAQTVKLAAILQLLGVFPLREICRKREGGDIRERYTALLQLDRTGWGRDALGVETREGRRCGKEKWSSHGFPVLLPCILQPLFFHFFSKELHQGTTLLVTNLTF